jgi:Mn-dependent DtxR family transcriptional regulator
MTAGDAHTARRVWRIVTAVPDADSRVIAQRLGLDLIAVLSALRLLHHLGYVERVPGAYGGHASQRVVRVPFVLLEGL